jgi:type IV pilus assembly protein PilB
VSRARIGELLVEARLISQASLEEALASPRAEGQKLGQVLVELGLVNEDQLTQTLSMQLSVPWVSLYHIDFSRELLNRVPRDVAEKFCAVPIFVRMEKKKATLYIAMDDPTNEQAISEISAAASLPVKPMIASQSHIRAAIRVYYAPEADAAPQPPTTREPSVTNLAAAAPVPPAAPAKPHPPPPPVTGRAPLATVVDAMEVLQADHLGDSPDAAPELEVSEYVPKPRPVGGPRMVALTLLDGTTLNLPARAGSQPSLRKEAASVSAPAAPRPPSPLGISDQLTARDLVSALRAVAHGADASEILGETQWQAMFAALLSLMLKKNLIADWEFIEELRNI